MYLCLLRSVSSVLPVFNLRPSQQRMTEYVSFLMSPLSVSFFSVLQVCLSGRGGHGGRQGQLRYELPLLRHVHPGHPGALRSLSVVPVLSKSV